jgi:hypothetical protein
VRTRRIAGVLIVVLAAIGSTACNTAPSQLVSVRINTPTTALAVGQSFQLTATAVYADKSEVDVTQTCLWQSPESAFVVVTPRGIVSGLNPGSGIVKATYFSQSTEVRFTVQ